MICGVTVFHLSLLYLDSQSFKIVWKFYLPAPSYYSFSGSWLWRKQTLELLVILNIFSLFINNYCWPEHVIPWAGREGYCSDSYLSDLTSKQSICQPQSSGYSDDVSYVWGLPHVSEYYFWLNNTNTTQLLFHWFSSGWNLLTQILIFI